MYNKAVPLQGRRQLHSMFTKLYSLLSQILTAIQEGNKQSMANQADLIAAVQTLQTASQAEATAVASLISGQAADITALQGLVAELQQLGPSPDQSAVIAQIEAITTQLNTNATNAAAALSAVNAATSAAQAGLNDAATIVIHPTSIALGSGETIQFTAQVLDAVGLDITSRVTVEWSSQGPAPITPGGLLGPPNVAGGLSVTATVGTASTTVTGGTV